MRSIAEKVRPRVIKEKLPDDSSESEAIEDQEALKIAKLQKLQALEAQLQSIETQEAKEITKPVADGLETLESSIAQGIQHVTKGEQVLQESITDSAISKELDKLQAEIATEEIAIVKTPYEKLVVLHEWIEQPQYGFMYAIPNKKKQQADFESWRDEWGHVLLDYARVNIFHVVFPKSLLTEPPFNKFIDRATAIQELCNTLVEKKLAKWAGKKTKQEELRVYWKSLDEWVAVIEKWALDHAILDVIMVADIRNSNQEFASLPIEDLREIFKTLEKNARATMVELEEGQFGIKFHFV